MIAQIAIYLVVLGVALSAILLIFIFGICLSAKKCPAVNGDPEKDAAESTSPIKPLEPWPDPPEPCSEKMVWVQYCTEPEKWALVYPGHASKTQENGRWFAEHYPYMGEWCVVDTFEEAKKWAGCPWKRLWSDNDLELDNLLNGLDSPDTDEVWFCDWCGKRMLDSEAGNTDRRGVLHCSQACVEKWEASQ